MLREGITRARAFGLIAAAAGTAALLPQAVRAATIMPYDPMSMDVFGLLHRDHGQIHMTINQMIDDPTMRTDALNKLSLLFAVHNSTEESFIYPAIANVANRPSDAMTLSHEQDEAKMLTWQLSQMHQMGSSDFTATAKKFRTAVLAHVAQEENVDFPKLKKAYGPATLSTVSKHVAIFRQHLTTGTLS